MAELPQAGPSVETCVSCATLPDSKSAPAQILGFAGLGLPKQDEHQQCQNLSGYGDGFAEVNAKIEDTQAQQGLCSTGSCGKLFSMQVTEKQECNVGLMMGNAVQNVSSQASESACMEGQGKPHETPYDDGDRVVNAHVLVDVDACSNQMGKLSVFAGEEKTGELGEVELSPPKKGMETKAAHAANEQNGDALNISSDLRVELCVASPRPRKQSGWNTPECAEPRFTMEASSWPTLAEAHCVKRSQARSSDSIKELASISLPDQKVPSSQEKYQERPLETIKHTNVNTSVPGSKFKSSYKKGGYGKPGSATENLPIPPMGVHVPSANMYIPDQSVKGNGLMGINNFFPGPHQAPAHGSFHYPRSEGPGHFPHNSAVLPTYGRGHPGWQHYGRGYVDANYKHTGFISPYDQQHMGPRQARQPVTPFMNMNVAHYSYPNYQGDMSYMPGMTPPGLKYATPYFGPSGPSGMMVQAPADIPMLQEMLQKQIEYYFSTENLCHDTFLTSKMDDEGYVPLSLIASFPRVRSLTSNTMLILAAMKNSTRVEVKSGKLRSHDWRRWKPILSGTSGMQGIERSNQLGPLNYTRSERSENLRDEENGELEVSQEGHCETMSSFPETRMVAGLCAAGISANLGAVSVPTVTSIDSR